MLTYRLQLKLKSKIACLFLIQRISECAYRKPVLLKFTYSWVRSTHLLIDACGYAQVGKNDRPKNFIDKSLKKPMDNINVVKETTLTAGKKPLILQSWTKFLEQSKGIKENWTGLEKSDIWFCVLSDCFAKFLFLEWRLMYPPKN